jgi:hypothetical protein
MLVAEVAREQGLAVDRLRVRPAQAHGKARAGRRIDELLRDRAGGRHRRRRFEPILAVVPVQHDDLRAAEGALEMALDECVRLALVLHHLQRLRELALGGVVLGVGDAAVVLATAHPAEEHPADGGEGDAQQDDQHDGALDRVAVAVGALGLYLLHEAVIRPLEAPDQVGPGGGRDRRDGSSVPDPDHDVVRDSGPALRDPLLFRDRLRLAVTALRIGARAVGCGCERGRGFVVILEKSFVPRLGPAAQRALAGEDGVEHRAGRLALLELARADAPLSGRSRPGDPGDARDERDQDGRKT